MKYSIKRQMMTVFVGLILFMIVVFMIVNGSFLEKYYISNKKSEFIKAYTMVQEGVENGTIDFVASAAGIFCIKIQIGHLL